MLSVQRGLGGGDGLINRLFRTPLVVPRLRICLPMQETRVQSLVRENPTWCGAAEPVHWNSWSPCSTTREATTMRSLPTAPREQSSLATTWEELVQQQRLSTTKRDKHIKLKEKYNEKKFYWRERIKKKFIKHSAPETKEIYKINQRKSVGRI